MDWISKSFHLLNRFRRQVMIFLAVLGPGVIVMVADNDAGGITTYTATGAQEGNHLLWFLIRRSSADPDRCVLVECLGI